MPSGGRDEHEAAHDKALHLRPWEASPWPAEISGCISQDDGPPDYFHARQRDEYRAKQALQ